MPSKPYSYLLDNTIFSRWNDKNTQEWIKSVDDDKIFLSPIVYAESLKGIYKELRVTKSKKNKITEDEYNSKTAQLQKSLRSLIERRNHFSERQKPVTVEVAHMAEEWLDKDNTSANDKYICASAIHYELVAATHNVKDFSGYGALILNLSKTPHQVQKL